MQLSTLLTLRTHRTARSHRETELPSHTDVTIMQVRIRVLDAEAKDGTGFIVPFLGISSVSPDNVLCIYLPWQKEIHTSERPGHCSSVFSPFLGGLAFQHG